VFFVDFLNLDLLEKTINDRVNGEVLEGKVGGSAVAVTQCGKTVFENYYGFQDVEKTVSVNSKTMYRLASMTKPVTAFAAVLEMDRGHLDLFDPVEKYLPKYKELNIGRLD
jgi:CubicO group peptidase (beta-lactamase class C family)